MRFVKWIRPVVLFPLLLVWLAIAGFGGSSIGQLSEVQENDSTTFLPVNAESTLAAEERAAFTQSDSLPALYVFDSVTTPEQFAEIQEFVADVAQADLGDGRTIGDALVGPATAVPSADGEAVLAVFPISADVAFERADGETLASVIGETMRELWQERNSATEGYLTGAIGLVVDQTAAFGAIDTLLLAVALVFVFVIHIIVYRSPILPFLVLGASMFAFALAALAVYYAADADLITLNGQSQGIMSILVIGATTDYALLLVARYREELRRHASTYEAMQYAWKQSVGPILASGITVILGVLMLLLSNLKSNQGLGPVAAFGIAAAIVAALTLLPALLLIAGQKSRAIFWPRRPRFDADGLEEVDKLEAVEQRAGVWGKISKSVAAKPRRTWLLAFAGLAVLAAFMPTFRADGVGQDDFLLGDIESVAGLDVLREHFDAGATDPVQIVADENTWQEVVTGLQSVEGVSAAYAVTPAVQQGAPGGVIPEPPVVIDGRVAIDVITVADAQSQEAKETVALIREAVQAVDSTALVGGTAAVGLDINVTTDRDLTIIIPMVLLVIFVVLIILLRSIVTPLIIVLANVLSFAATIGLSAIFFNYVFNFPGSDSSVPLFSFVFLVALGVDYSIFLMSRAREESLRWGNREGVRRALAVTGGVITSAGIVLAATFAALGFLPILFLVQIAFIVSVGVLIDTLVVRTLLVPGLVDDIGRRSWWPGHKQIAE